MSFILTNAVTGEIFKVNRDCVDRVKGKMYMNSLINKVEMIRKPIEIHFEGDYDLKIVSK